MRSSCSHCGGPLARQRRTPAERLLFRRVMGCERCGRRERERRIPFESTVMFLSARHTRCIQCGTPRVRRLPVRDRIDRMSRHPYSLLLGLTGAPIYYCGACRLQHHDWRSPEPDLAAQPAGETAP